MKVKKASVSSDDGTGDSPQGIKGLQSGMGTLKG